MMPETSYIIRMFSRASALALAAVIVSGCIDKDTAQKAMSAVHAGPKPDELPTMLNKEPPFRYPAALFAQKVQGNVTLRIFIDRDGRIHPESTAVAEPSGYPALDSAAIKGSEALQFVPAKLRGEPLAVSILFPVLFRHPDARPLSSDTALNTSSSTKIP